jgi:hypothetical protein
MKFGFGTILWRSHSIGFILRQEIDRKIAMKHINKIWSGWTGRARSESMLSVLEKRC